MMLRTSSRNLNPTFGMFKNTLRKNLALIILISVGVLLYCPGWFISSMGDNLFVDTPTWGSYSPYPNNANAFMLILAVIGGGSVLLFNLLNFMFLYSKRSSDVFHALPLTRTELLLSRCASGFAFSLIPTLLGFISLSVLNSFVANGIKLSHIWMSFLFVLAFMLACSAISMLFVVCAGSAFDLAISFFGANVALLIVGVVFCDVLENSLLGYSGGNVLKIIEVLSPFVYFGKTIYLQLFSSISGRQVIAYFIRCIAFFAVFGALSVVLYNHRKNERGGQAYAYKFVYIACSLLCSISGAYLLGVMFASSYQNPLFWCFAIVGGIITSVIYGAVTNRGFKKFKLSAVIGAASTAVIALLVISVSLGGFGYVTRIPKAEDVAEVKLFFGQDDVTFEDPTMPLEIHHRIIDEGLSMTKGEYNRTHIEYAPDSTELYRLSGTMTLDYTLKNGKTVSRDYLITTKEGLEMMLPFLKSDERFDDMLDEFTSSTAKTVGIYGTFNVGQPDEQYFSTYLTASEFEKLISIYKSEIQAAKDVESVYKHTGLSSDITLAWSDVNGRNYCSYDFYLNYMFEGTNEYLKSIDPVAREAAEAASEALE